MKKLDLISFSKWQAYLFALVGLILGVLYSFGGLILDALVSLGWFTTSETQGLGLGTLLAFGALIGIPLIFAVLGFLTGIVEALAFNFFSKKLGAFGLSYDSLFGYDEDKK